MKNIFYCFSFFIFSLNNINVLASNDAIKEVEAIEFIHTSEKEFSSSDIDNEEKTSSDVSLSEESILESPKEDYNSEELKTTNIISTNKDLKTNKEEIYANDKFEEISDRTNRVTALGSAMGAIDLSKTPLKKIRLGAGVGHSTNNQAVAVGVGYAPTERLRLNTKFSTSTTSTKSNGISIGASYDLDW